jgi:hypothetical protein
MNSRNERKIDSKLSEYLKLKNDVSSPTGIFANNINMY